MRFKAVLLVAALACGPVSAQTFQGLAPSGSGAPPKLTPTPQTQALARRTVEAQMRADQARELDAEASGLLAQAQIASIADPTRRGPLPAPAALRSALEQADKANLDARIAARAQLLAETLTPDELAAYSAFVTSPAYAGIQGKMSYLDRQAQQAQARASDQRRIAALTSLCQSGSGQFQAVYCKMKDDAETDANLRAGGRR